MFPRYRQSPRATKHEKMVDWRDHNMRGWDRFCLALTMPMLLLVSHESTRYPQQLFCPEFTFRRVASSPHTKPGSVPTALACCPNISPTRQGTVERYLFECACI